MENTTLNSGIFKVSDDEKCSIDVTLNGKTENVPLEYQKTPDNSYTFEGVMNLEIWDAIASILSLNKACEGLSYRERRD